MPCDQNWTVDVVFNAPADTTPRTLVFCLNLNGDTISGDVDLFSNGQSTDLSLVTGTTRVLTDVPTPDPTRPIRLMTLNFNWGTTRVVLSGTIFPVGAQNRFACDICAFAVLAAGAPSGSRPHHRTPRAHTRTGRRLGERFSRGAQKRWPA